MTPIPARVLKNPGEFDWDAATVLNSNSNDAGPFDLNSALGREEALSLLSQKNRTTAAGPKKVFGDASRAFLGATHMLSAIFERFITMKTLLIPLISFIFVCTLKATNIDDVIIKG